jgi:hypothetical protein
MPADIQTVRRLAMALPEVEEGVCFGTPAFYIKGRLMARLREDDETLMVRFPKLSREESIETNPDVFSVTDHYQNYPAVLINLLAVNPDLLAKMIEGAWRMQAPKRLVERFDADQAEKKSK